MINRKPFRVISASQMLTAELSFRKWFFEKILRLPYRRKGHFGFGSVLASCLERYLNAGPDDRLPDGTVVDLYPESYEVHEFGRPTGKYERWDAQLEKPQTEGPLIKELVAEAIEKSFLLRTGDRWVEWEIPQVTFVEDVRIMGFGDLAYPADAAIWDHKSTKNFRYNLSKPKMKKNIQLVLYAKVMLERFRTEGTPVPPIFTLGHLYYLKDGGVPYGERVKRKYVKITPDEIDARFEEIMAHSRQMHRYSKVETDQWEQVPCSGEECARAYGGCPYLTICGGEETLGQYIKRLDTLDSMRRLAKIETPSPEENMATAQSLVDRIKTGDLRKPPAVPAPAAAPAVDPALGTTPIPPPWAQTSCPSCSGSGWNPQGEPCNICVGLSKFDLTTITITGPKSWEGDGADPTPEAPAPEAAPAPAVAPEPSAPARTAAKGKMSLASLLGKPKASSAPAPAPESEAAAVTALAHNPDGDPLPDPPPVTVITTDPAAKPSPGRGRPPGSKNKTRGFILCIGCTVQGPKGLDLTVVLDKAGAQLAEGTAAADGYYSMNPWDRRDMIARRIDAIIEEHIPNGAVVFLAARNPDLDALASALSPKAVHVIHSRA